MRKNRSSLGTFSSISSSAPLESRSNSQSSSASILYSEGSPVRKLYESDIHQPSEANWIICSLPLSVVVYHRRRPFSTNAIYLHTSPCCNNHCLFLNFFGMKKVLLNCFSSSVRLICSSNFWNNDSNMRDFNKQK